MQGVRGAQPPGMQGLRPPRVPWALGPWAPGGFPVCLLWANKPGPAGPKRSMMKTITREEDGDEGEDSWPASELDLWVKKSNCLGPNSSKTQLAKFSVNIFLRKLVCYIHPKLSYIIFVSFAFVRKSQRFGVV